MDVIAMRELGGSSVSLPGYKDPETGGMTFLHPMQDEIDMMETDFLIMSVNLWMTFKRCGLPHGRGWFEERATVIDIINILESESNRYDAWAMKHRDDEPDDEDE